MVYDIDTLKTKLNQMTAGRHCYTMNDVLNGKYEPSIMENWKNSPFFAHAGVGDPTAGVFDVSTTVYDPVRPMPVARMIANVTETMNESIKLPIRTKGKIVGANRAKTSPAGQAGRRSFLQIFCKEEVGAEDTYDRNDIEDVGQGVVNYITQDLMADHDVNENQIMVDLLDGLTRSELAKGEALTFTGNALTYDLLIDAQDELQAINQEPDTLLINTHMRASLLKSQEFKDLTWFGEAVNRSNGHLGNFLGTNIYVMPQINDNKAYMFNKFRAIQYVIRRDKLVTPFQMDAHTWKVDLTTRYGIDIADKTAILAMGS